MATQLLVVEKRSISGKTTAQVHVPGDFLTCLHSDLKLGDGERL